MATTVSQISTELIAPIMKEHGYKRSGGHFWTADNFGNLFLVEALNARGCLEVRYAVLYRAVGEWIWRYDGDETISSVPPPSKILTERCSIYGRLRAAGEFRNDIQPYSWPLNVTVEQLGQPLSRAVSEVALVDLNKWSTVEGLLQAYDDSRSEVTVVRPNVWGYTALALMSFGKDQEALSRAKKQPEDSNLRAWIERRLSSKSR